MRNKKTRGNARPAAEKPDLVRLYVDALDKCYGKPDNDECFRDIAGILKKMPAKQRPTVVISTFKLHEMRGDNAKEEMHVLRKMLKKFERALSEKDWERIEKAFKKLDSEAA